MHRLKIKKWNKVSNANVTQKKARVAMFTTDKIDFKYKKRR